MIEDEEVKRLVEKEMEEYERDFSKLSGIEQCPKCGGGLDKGYTIMIRGSEWNENKPGFLKFAGLNKPLTNVRWKVPAFPSLRCRTCHFVTFDYTIEVERGTVTE
jgi:hypothetical protein